MLFAVFALLLGVAFAGPLEPAIRPYHSWNQEFTVEEWNKVDHRQAFNDWKAHFDYSWPTLEEEAFRYGLWLDAMKMISEHNSLLGASYKLRMNQFGGLTDDEFKIRVHGHTRSCLHVPPLEGLREPGELEKVVPAPSSVDWQAAGDVTPVKNQGQCGSCWAFASTGCIECDYAIKNGQLNSLSEQQLVDCTRSYGNYGCNGGWWYNAFAYVEQEGGLCSESEYPYTARDGSCKDKTCGTKYDPISGDIKVTPDNGAALENAVAQGCAAVGVEADQAAFQYYSSGILTGNCGTNIDHGVLAVGYGTSGSQNYWKVKNSWGASWGDNGYIYICKDCNKNGNKGECGINMYPYLVTPQ